MMTGSALTANEGTVTGMAEIELTLNSPITEEQWDAITDVDFDKTDRVWFQTKHGKTVEFVKSVAGILIKNRRMPETCFDCPCVDTEFGECKASYHLSLHKDEYGAVDGVIPGWCPLMDVSKPKPTTHADRIRAMSDEKMMEYMYHNCHCPPELDELPSCPYRKKNRVQTKDCRTCWLDWLKQEVDSDPT